MKHNTKHKIGTNWLVGVAMFSALAFLITFVVRFPVIFLTFDAKDAVIAIASFMYGPVSAVVISLIAALLELLTVSSTGIYGFIMNFLSSAVFSFVASLIYSRRKSFGAAVFGLYFSVIILTGVMMVLNLYITPLYMGVDRTAVVQLLPTVLLPFNFAKAMLNAGLALFFYKPCVKAMRRAGLMKPSHTAQIKEASAPKAPAGGASLAVTADGEQTDKWWNTQTEKSVTSVSNVPENKKLTLTPTKLAFILSAVTIAISAGIFLWLVL